MPLVFGECGYVSKKIFAPLLNLFCELMRRNMVGQGNTFSKYDCLENVKTYFVVSFILFVPISAGKLADHTCAQTPARTICKSKIAQ